MPEPTARTEPVPDEVMRAFVNGAIESPPEVKANSPQWIRNGLARALAAYEATGLAEMEAQRRRADEAEQALREEVTAMAEERIVTGRANILNVIRERDEQTQRAEEAERERDDYATRLRLTDKAYAEAAARAEEAEARLRRYDTAIATARRDKLAAEAAVRRVQAVADAMRGTPGTRAWGDRLDAAITGTALRPGLRVHELRTARGWSLVDLADAAGLTRATVRNIETGDTEPLPESLNALAAALDVPRAALDTEQPTTPARVVVDRADLTSALIPISRYIDRTPDPDTADHLTGVHTRFRAALEPPKETR
ncbi:helix-turn-helix domain-containing protein [Actinomadura geliboluensis]|uniref:helix-turn-helix domain-containing protein n=1 Tax=Actinomadura geliboluensis TaxID=882440 RepID=UPI00367E7B8C